MKWHTYFFNLIKVIKQKSKDPNTQVGCIIVGKNNQILSTGYNDFPFGVQNSKERWERPLKYKYVAHAEMNSICLAARSGTCLDNAIMYLEYIPCVECTKLIIQSGIRTIYYSLDSMKEWNSKKYNEEELKISKEMLNEAEIHLIGIGENSNNE